MQNMSCFYSQEIFYTDKFINKQSKSYFNNIKKDKKPQETFQMPQIRQKCLWPNKISIFDE